MIPGLEMLACQDLAVPVEIMEHVVQVESSRNPYAIGVVGGRLARQPRSLEEAVATAAQLEREGYNFSLGLAQVNRHNLAAQGLTSYELAFEACPNLEAGARILADCHLRAGGDWGKAFSCYYSGNFTRGFRDGYVEKIRRSLATSGRRLAGDLVAAIPLPGGMPASTDGGLLARRAAAATPAAATPAAAMPDAATGRPRIPAAPAPQQGGGPGTGSAGSPDDAPFVPWVSPPGAGHPVLRPTPVSPSHGSGGDSAFVF